MKIQLSSIKWLINRLKVMSLAEIAWRIVNFIRIRLEKLGFFHAKINKIHSNVYGLPWFNVQPNINSKLYIVAADKIMQGCYDIFSLKNVDIGFPPYWNKDPKTLTIAPLGFGKMINYRNELLVGNIKYLWEPNRHLELVTLSQAYVLTKDARYANAVKTLVESWINQCPYPMGLNWTSSLEHSIRIVNWSVSWFLLGGQNSILFEGIDGQKFKKIWLNSIYQHLYFISGHFSKYSSANNHLLGEYMGLFVGSMTWPLWKESKFWIRLSKQGFEEEVYKQNSIDGVNLEQGIWYQHEVADMILICGLLAKANNINFSEKYWERLESMLNFICSIMDVNGHVPMLGDSDDALMLRLTHMKDFNVYRSLLATGAVLFNRPDFKIKSGRLDDKSIWLLGEKSKQNYASLDGSLVQNNNIQREYPEGGYYLLGNQLNKKDEVRCLVDAGELGYLAIAAHGHADALSLVLNVAGKEILIDPGTYAYHTQKKWREYFRGTSAHNTIEIDETSQSVSGGNFLWSFHAKSHCVSFDSSLEKDVFIGYHDGYQRLEDPVTHQRTVTLVKENNQLLIEDQLLCQLNHDVSQYWHFSEFCHVNFQEPGMIEIQQDNISLILFYDKEFKAEIITAQEDPPLGWISRSFDNKIPCNTLKISKQIFGKTIIQTVFQIKFISES